MNEIERLKKALIDDPGAESTAKSFGILIPIIETPHGLSVLFEVRAKNLRRQPGEICFPGGSTMEGEPPTHTAIREASVPVEGFPYDRIEGGKAYAWDSSYRTIYFYQYDGRNIWGLTAGIVNDFIEKIKRGGYLK